MENKKWDFPVVKSRRKPAERVNMETKDLTPSTRLMPGVLENVMIRGDLSNLTPEQKINYYQSLCHSLNLNPMTKPFEYIQLQGRLVLYATRSATDQLRQIHKVSITIAKRDLNETHYSVIAQAKTPDGRTDEAMGVVTVIGLKGNDLANALMKCETKAKRRVALSICGLGFLDENEPETISNAKMVTRERLDTGEIETVEYTVPFGKYKDYRLEDISVLTSGEHDQNETALKGYVKYIREKAATQNKEIYGDVKEFLERADVYLAEVALNKEMGQAMERDQ